MANLYASLSSLAVVAAIALALLFKLQSTSQPEELSYQRLQISVADPDGAVQHLAKVLSFPTLASRGAANSIVNPEPFQQLHQYLQTTYATVYQRLKVELVHDFSLLFTWEGADPTLKPILLMSHLDVVPAPTEGPGYNWTYPPFSGTVADGYIWGRGALDVKIGVVSLLEAVTELLRQDFKPRRTIHLAFGHDEEVGGPYGAHGLALLLQSRGVQLELVLDEGGIVLSDGIKASGLTLVDKPLALIGTAEKGFETWELHISGTGGHSSMPPVGPDYVAARLSRVLADLLANPPPASLIHPVIDWTKAMGAAVRQAPLRLLLQNSDNKLLRPLLAQALTQAGDDIAALVRTTCGVVGVQAGGIADNVLPTSATVKLNFRLLPGDNSSMVRQYLQSATHKHKEYVQIEALNPDQNKAPDVTPSDGPHFQLIKQAIMETLAPPEGMVVAPYLLTGTTDSRYYGSVVPIAAGRVFRFLPQFLSRGEGDIRRIHGVDERVGVDDYLRGIGFYLRFMQLAASDASDEERAVA